jgi:hypothetical protein
MPQLNADPHADGYHYTPENCVTALFAPGTDMAAVRTAALAAGKDAGLTDDCVFVFQGAEGAAQIDIQAHKQGAFARLRRGVDNVLSDQMQLLEQADRVLKSGGGAAAIYVGPPDDQDPHKAKRAANFLKTKGGEEVYYWGGLAIERMSGEPVVA